jgi:Family of unknown function (DUF5681)
MPNSPHHDDERTAAPLDDADRGDPRAQPSNESPPPPRSGTVMAATSLIKQRRRGPGRPFVKGQSGNPAGRTRGSRNAATLLWEHLVDGQAEWLMRDMLGRARSGNFGALRFSLERLVPPARESVEIELPTNEAGIDLEAAADAILVATAAGEISPEAGRALSDLIQRRIAVAAATDLTRRLEAVERAIAQLPARKEPQE